MKKPKPITIDEIRAEYSKAMLAGIVKKEIDENAFSIRELCDLLGYKHAQVDRIASKRVAAGEWEKVWKQGSQWLVPAYRPAKKKK